MLQEYFSELNKTGYTTTPVACGWAGAVIEGLGHMRRSSERKKLENALKVGSLASV